jgi:CNT family concentrative nucleoside transporter
LTGVSLNWEELWQSSVIIGRRLFETAIPPYQALGVAAALPEAQRVLSDRAVVIISYALSGFAHLASVGIFVGGTIALIPSRRKDISELGWKALFAGTLATMMIAAVSGVFYDPSNPSILGERKAPEAQVSPAPIAAPITSPTPGSAVSPSPASVTSPVPAPLPVPAAPVAAPAKPSPKPAANTAPKASPSPAKSPAKP